MVGKVPDIAKYVVTWMYAPHLRLLANLYEPVLTDAQRALERKPSSLHLNVAIRNISATPKESPFAQACKKLAFNYFCTKLILQIHKKPESDSTNHQNIRMGAVVWVTA